ncbi:hypothetical protein H6G89_31980 [Oscillatoria sp. FACHB-1407]|uniref:hypothetical protein n=1 Tax=Oscillatoria sp. FACHB-1407 TaxID=2692847 RepID=UPI0016857D6E|nr:hypothetical protein [Oscillatoria sp. FACHB-1407]MBD2465613.1 hypothetical protein [Oscillatoria sp. FACHB-1407]
MLKWTKAVYQPNGNSLKVVYPDQLHDPNVRAFLRTQELWDESQEYRLSIRNRLNTPHFCSLSKTKRYLRGREESSNRHRSRVDELLTQLQKQNFLFGYNSFDDGNQTFVPLFRGKDYTWTKEVTRTLSSTAQWRHDVFGAELSHRHTERHPWVAIEVIDTHFPDDITMEAWLKISSELPYFILFDFVKRKNYFLKVNEDKQQVRVIYFIYDGAMWKSGFRWNECSSALFKEKVSKELSVG